MSRAERRAYKRMTRNQDPYALPANAQQRLKAQQKQRTRRVPPRAPGEFEFYSRRFLTWFLGGGAVAGLLGFSVTWPSGMPFALYVGLAAATAWLAVLWLFRTVQRRAAASR